MAKGVSRLTSTARIDRLAIREAQATDLGICHYQCSEKNMGALSSHGFCTPAVKVSVNYSRVAAVRGRG